MNITLTMLAIIQLIGSVVVGVAVLYITYRLVSWIVGRNYQIGEKNTAFSIFVSAIMFSVGYLVSSVIQPLLSTFRTINARATDFWSVFFQFSRYLFLFVAISSLIAMLVNLVSTSVFMRFTTKTNELKEIAEGNLSVAIITSVVIIIITLFAKESATLLLESIVPYPGGDVFGKP